jgi:hypothetical protein
MGPTMAELKPQVRSKRFKRQRTDKEYRLYLAALEWSFGEPIVIATETDLRSRTRWGGQVQPHPRQIANLLTFSQQVPASLLADEVGLDNAITAGLVASELIARKRASKLLVVCSKIMAPEWRHMLEESFRVPAQIAIGSDLVSAIPEDVGAVITTHHSAWLHLEEVPSGRFDLLVLDEADRLRHLLRNLRGSDQPAHVPAVFREALEQRKFANVLMMTNRPFQNNLWDVYYLIDLIAAARGHTNPFGSENTFSVKYIADSRVEARQLRPHAYEEFQSILSRYVSRARRDDLRLTFPDRVVQPMAVQPNPRERELFALLAKPIELLEPAAQAALLFALTSSPNAVLTELDNLAQSFSISDEVLVAARGLIGRMPLTGKLQGLKQIIDRLRLATPENWRLIVFTGSEDTQRRIQVFLEGRDIPVGIVRKAFSSKDQEILSQFRKVRPEIRVIVCADFDSEILDLPLSTSIVHYDLPWDPLTVERRIGQVRRLWAHRATINIFNLMFAGTFEEQVVSRLIMRLQSAARTMGDLAPLLRAAGLSSEDDGDSGFDGWILQLAMASLAGKDVEAVVRQIEQNIGAAKLELISEEKNARAILGNLIGAEGAHLRPPSLWPNRRSMSATEFAQAGLESLGARLTLKDEVNYWSERDGDREVVTFEDRTPQQSDDGIVVYAPGTRAFAELVKQVSAVGLHLVDDLDKQTEKQANEVAQRWVADFGATFLRAELLDVARSFEGSALMSVRASVASDSYERLLEVACSGNTHIVWNGRNGLASIKDDMLDGAAVGINSEALYQAAIRESTISEFSRFYKGRRKQEMLACSQDGEKKTKLAEHFSPRFEVALERLRGSVYRRLKLRVHYKWEGNAKYASEITVAPYFNMVVEAPPLERCAQTDQLVPQNCLERCEITGAKALRHKLFQSHTSGRRALRENTIICTLSKQRILIDEAEVSQATGQIVARSLLKRSSISGKVAEPEQFGQCEFTQIDALLTELGVSQISGKSYRLDEESRSVVSGKSGHRSEFGFCDVTEKPLVPGEGKNCELTGYLVDPNILVRCTVSGTQAIPTELERCAASGNWALKKYFVTSSVSGARFMERFALRSSKGKFCTPAEGRRCMWSGRKHHPDDLRTCALTGVEVHFKFITSDGSAKLRPLTDLLYGMRRTADASDLWDSIAAKASATLGGGRWRLEAAQTSPDGRHLAVCSEVRSLLGRSVQQAGLLYSFSEDQIVGRIALGKRSPTGWITAG